VSAGGQSWADPKRPQLFAVENPDEPDMDVGRNSWAVGRVRGAFLHGFHALRASCTTRGKSDDRESILGAIISPHDRLLSRKMSKSGSSTAV